LRDRKADTPAAANGWIKALRQVFEWGKQEWDEIEANSAREVGYLPGRVGGHPAWDEIDVARFLERHLPGTKAALALAISTFHWPAPFRRRRARKTAFASWGTDIHSSKK
jgi:hypothetical protein